MYSGLLGATPEGKKELIGFADGYRESTQSWKELLLDLRHRGLNIAPKLAIGDGALGFFAAVRDVYGNVKAQRCWVHKTANVLNCVPKSIHDKVKSSLHDVWMAETKEDANVAFALFLSKYRDKYDKAAQCLEKDKATLLSFYDFPAAHWKHIRTTNPIESIFATVRHRTKRSKGCLSRKTAMPMIFKLIMAAEKRWQRLNGRKHLPKLIQGVIFQDGEQVITKQNQIAA